MNKIIVLPSEISQKIAAGEVVERPASIVKELVENSLDAGASEVKVEILDGGKKLIRVTDNGQGMSREDAQLCFARHSTSKISREEDLFQISTLGFRGEALPSISAVSRVTLKTSDGKEEKGTQVDREGEVLLNLSDVAFPRGTSVEVRDLFFNLPARRKFLRSEKSELSLIVKYLTFVALSYPEVRFSLAHGKREILNCPLVGSLRERIFQLFGKSLLETLMEVDYEENACRFNGFSSRPPSGKLDKAHQYFFVNKRPVKDRILQAALNQAYRGFLEKDTSPEAFLFLSIPYSDVDVNVHPAKAEVRFRDSQSVFHLILRSIERSMLEESKIKEIYLIPDKEKTGFKIEEASQAQLFRTPSEGKLDWKELSFPCAKVERSYPRVLGQYLDTYVIAEIPDGLLIIDQHNAHERILFEKYREINDKKSWPQKMALIPILFELSPSQVLNLENNQTLLEEAGFRVEAMGIRSYALKEFPDIFRTEQAKEIFLAFLEEIEINKIQDKKRCLLATLACKTAIKAGQPLSLEKMEYLVEELFKIPDSSLCPHGRPVVVKIDKAQIEKGMKR
jgi:DNA mismatch repair protein MutL